MKFTRVVLKPQATWSDVQTTDEGEVEEWDQQDVTGLTQDEPYMKWWKSVDGRCAIVFLQDPIRELRCYHLTGSDLKTHEAIIRGRMPTYDRGEIDAMMASARAPAQKVVAVYHAAAAVLPRRDPAIFGFLTRSLTDSDPAIRRAAVDAALVALWPDLRGPLERVAAGDPDADIRAFATETLETLRARAWGAAPGAFDFAPLPPDPRRVTPLTGVRDDWYEHAHGERPKPRVPAGPVPSRKPEFRPPEWLAKLTRKGDWGSVRWHTPEQVRAATGQFTEYTKPALLTLSETRLAREQSLWESMVPVADGPEFTDRVGRTERSRLFVNRDDPDGGLLLALGPDHPPSLWVPAGRTRTGVAASAASYFFPGIPAQSELPFQGRLFLATLADVGSGFVDVQRGVERSPFTDMLPWGSSHPTDPYPERVVLGQVPVRELRRYMAQDPNGLPRTSIRTRYSRSVIQLIDWRNGYFADLYFRPASPPGWAEAHNAESGTDFPAGTPVDVVGALSGQACLGPASIRPQAEAATDQYQRQGMQEVIGFLEEAARG